MQERFAISVLKIALLNTPERDLGGRAEVLNLGVHHLQEVVDGAGDALGMVVLSTEESHYGRISFKLLLVDVLLRRRRESEVESFEDKGERRA